MVFDVCVSILYMQIYNWILQATTSEFITIMDICGMIKIDTTDETDQDSPTVEHELPVVVDADSDDEFWARMAKNEDSPVKKKAHV